MSQPEPLGVDLLARRTDPAGLGFATTADVPDLNQVVGQDRAVEAIEFGVSMPGEGYNLLVMGPAGTGKHTAIRQFLAREAAGRPAPDDWCYVHNVADPRRPRALRLPAGRGRALRARMAAVIRELAGAIPAAMEGDEYRTRRLALEEGFKTRRDAAMGALQEKAMTQGIAIAQTPVGFGMAAIRNGEVVDPEAFGRLPAEEQARIKLAIAALETELEQLLATLQRWERDHRREVQALNEETVRRAVDQAIAEARAEFADLPEVLAFLDAADDDVTTRAGESLRRRGEEAGGDGSGALGALGGAEVAAHGGAAAVAAVAAAGGPALDGGSPFARCQVNLIVDNAGRSSAPVVHEDLPTHPNLMGQIEQVAHLGALVTDYTLIKAGALHRANGGYLVLDARRLLGQPYAWEELKRALRSRVLQVDRAPQGISWMATASIEPEPIPLDVKVVLTGERELLLLLAQADPDVAELFRIRADFDDRTVRTAQAERQVAAVLATTARREGLLPLDAGACAGIIDHAARLAGHADRLTSNLRALTDLAREANRLATGEGAATVAGGHVAAALAGRRRRAGRVAEEMRAAILEGAIRVETQGQAVGQVNGLSVAIIGEDEFGWPTRITARVRLGGGELIDIEREVALGGPIHSKGVLILAGFLGGRFGRRRPLALHASLVFEQSYGAVEGDSASMAELCAVLSAIAEVPIRQSLAITGSVDQLGRSQAVGGVNEKIEGFFDLCHARGLTGDQGVLIPAGSARSLMLRGDVLDAVRDGRFRVHAVDTVDEALELLTGVPAGEPDESGDYPAGTVNGLVRERLDQLVDASLELALEREALAARRQPGRPRTHRREPGKD